MPTRLVILKHTHNLSDEALCARWIEKRYWTNACRDCALKPRRTSGKERLDKNPHAMR
jgi:transposase, IS5 family